MRPYLIVVFFSAVLATPFLSFSAGLVPNCALEQCDFRAFFFLVQTFINYALMIAFPITACIFAYAGWLLITDQGSSKNVSQAWTLIKDAGTGFAIMLLAWVGVKFLLSKLLSQEYQPLLNSLFKTGQ